MTRATLPLASLLVALIFCPAARAADPQRLATMDELWQMYNAGQFQICLQHIAKVSPLAGKGYDKWELMLLKADCLLRLDDTAEALRIYVAAEKSPVTAQAAAGRAMEILIRRSQNLAYRSKTNPTPEAIAITVPESRKKALSALLDDELSAITPKLNKAMEAPSLPPLLDLAPDMINLWAIEKTGTGDDQKTSPLLAGMGERVRTLIDRDLQIRSEQLAGIREKANQVVDSPGSFWWQGGTTRRGLYTPDRKEIRELMTYLDKVLGVAELGQRYAWQLGRDGRKWDGVITHAKVTIAEAEKVLDAN